MQRKVVAAEWFWEGQLMGDVRYAFRVSGRTSDAVLTALQEGLDVDVAPTSTAMRGWLPDQAALFGMLARIRLLGLELLEVRRLPMAGSPSPPGTP
jgi:hypothetical protein